MSFFGWLIDDWHWLSLALACVVVWVIVLEPIVDKIMRHRRVMKQLDLQIAQEKRNTPPV
jgi:ABC-type cobalamin transport system permease subunit